MTGYEPRFYRDWSKDKDLISFTVAVKESDLYVRATRNLSRKALKVLLKATADNSPDVKRFYREGSRVRLQPENAAMDPIYADGDTDFAILGKVVALFRRI